MQKSGGNARMTQEPSDAETNSYVSISEASQSCACTMTCKVRLRGSLLTHWITAAVKPRQGNDIGAERCRNMVDAYSVSSAPNK